MKFEILEELYYQICREHTQRLYELYNSKFNNYNNSKPNSKKISIEFDSQEIANALSYSDELDTIVIYKGLLKQLHKCTQRMLEFEENFQTFEEKATISVFLLSLSIHFIICHEFAHLYCGHCDLLNKISNKKVHFHFKFDHDIGITPLDFQTLEMNADAIAMCRTIDYVMFKPYHSKLIIELIYNKNIEIDLLLKAMNINFFVLRDCMPPIYDECFETRRHHPNFLRQIMNMQTLKKYLQLKYNKPISDEMIDQHFSLDEKTLCELFYIPLNIEHYKNNLNQVYIEYEQKLRTNWNLMYCKLAPFSRVDLPPPF